MGWFFLKEFYICRRRKMHEKVRKDQGFAGARWGSGAVDPVSRVQAGSPTAGPQGPMKPSGKRWFRCELPRRMDLEFSKKHSGETPARS